MGRSESVLRAKRSRGTLDSLEHPVEASSQGAGEGELAPLESLVACVEYGLEVGAQRLRGVVVVQRAQ